MKCLVVSVIGLLLTVSLHAEVWTNTAGHSIDATLVGLDGMQAEFRTPDGKTFTLHLKALSKKEQLRARKRFPEPKKLTAEEKNKQLYQQRLRQRP